MILLLMNYHQNQISGLKGDIKIYPLLKNQIYQDLGYMNYYWIFFYLINQKFKIFIFKIFEYIFIDQRII